MLFGAGVSAAISVPVRPFIRRLLNATSPDFPPHTHLPCSRGGRSLGPGRIRDFYGCMKRARTPARPGSASGTPASSCGQAHRAEKATKTIHHPAYGMNTPGFQFRASFWPSPCGRTILHSARAAMPARRAASPERGPCRGCHPDGTERTAPAPSICPATIQTAQRIQRHIHCRSACADSVRQRRRRSGSVHVCRARAGLRPFAAGHPPCQPAASQAASRAASACSMAATAASKASRVDVWRGG